MENFRKAFREVIYISRLTGVTKKKLRVVFSVILSNLTVLSDILIILYFAKILSGENSEYNFLNYVLENNKLLPVIVILRFAFIYIEQANIVSLKLQVEKNLKLYLIAEVYKKGNYSIADANYYIGTLSGHIGYFYQGLTSLLNSSIQVIVYSSFLIFTDINTISIFGLGIAVLFIPTRFLLKLGRKYMHEAYVNGRKASREIERVVQNIFLIKILDTIKFELENFSQTTEKVKNANYKNQIYGTLNSLTPNFLTIFTVSILIVVFDILKSLTLEFLGVTLRLVQTIGTFNKSLNMIINSHVHLSSFMNLENNKLIIDSKYFQVQKDANYGIKIENLKFKYFNAEDYIFDNLNLEIERNKHTVITGPNGSGKSTLLGLISKVFYPEEGSISSFTDKVGYVGVTPLILNGSLRDNFLYGNKLKKSDDELIEYMNTFELFGNSEENLEYIVNNKSLSSGQMQKVAFIRCLLADVELLLLDESTSNLDVSSRKLIFNILKDRDITIINSTHSHEDFSYDNHLKIILEENQRKILTN
tara:strand:+ start:3284 stop:4882 length:1599 start_codon:yes stop_codon:yes gene_type:complete